MGKVKLFQKCPYCGHEVIEKCPNCGHFVEIIVGH